MILWGRIAYCPSPRVGSLPPWTFWTAYYSEISCRSPVELIQVSTWSIDYSILWILVGLTDEVIGKPSEIFFSFCRFVSTYCPYSLYIQVDRKMDYSLLCLYWRCGKRSRKNDEASITPWSKLKFQNQNYSRKIVLVGEESAQIDPSVRLTIVFASS